MSVDLDRGGAQPALAAMADERGRPETAASASRPIEPVERARLAELEVKLGYTFRDPALLRDALIHTSYANEAAVPRPESNERLEFLGDAVIELIVAEQLYRDRPDLPEGDLTAMRAAIVRLETLSRVGQSIGLGAHLLLGHGEESTGGRQRGSIIGRALEAIFGAIYLDGDHAAARGAVLHLLAAEMARLTERQALKDDRSRLQEAAQAELAMTPSYRTVAAVGPDHAKEFTVEVSLDTLVVGRGIGRTKQSAAQAAARDALGRWPPALKQPRD